jgi:uncharacterized protein
MRLPEIEWDERKRAINLQKHQLDFEDARRLDWDTATIVEDVRYAYPERRFWAFVRRDGRFYVVTFCYRGVKLRVISFRRAHMKEVKKHVA